VWAVVMSVGFAILVDLTSISSPARRGVFFIPHWFSLIVLFAVGVESLSRFPMHVAAGRRGRVRLWSPWPATAPTHHGRQRRGATLRTGHFSRTLPDNAILLTSADYEAFPVAYLQTRGKGAPGRCVARRPSAGWVLPEICGHKTDRGA